MQKVFWSAKWGCTGAEEGLGGAKDSWETFAPWAQKSQKDLLHPPLTTFGHMSSTFQQFNGGTFVDKIITD